MVVFSPLCHLQKAGKARRETVRYKDVSRVRPLGFDKCLPDKVVVGCVGVRGRMRGRMGCQCGVPSAALWWLCSTYYIWGIFVFAPVCGVLRLSHFRLLVLLLFEAALW